MLQLILLLAYEVKVGFVVKLRKGYVKVLLQHFFAFLHFEWIFTKASI